MLTQVAGLGHHRQDIRSRRYSTDGSVDGNVTGSDAPGGARMLAMSSELN